MLNSSNMIFLLSLFILASSTLLIVPVAATDHIVGANRGWNPGINYTLWANNQTFYTGDYISFRYQKTQYSVFEVNQTGYDNCTTEGALRNWTSGKDFIMLNDAKRYYFIGGNGQCFNGMKVTVLVHPLPSPPASTNSSTDSSAPVITGRDSVVLRVVLGLVSMIVVVSGWI